MCRGLRTTILIAATLITLCLAPAARAAAPPLVGIGEQNPEIFGDAHWRALGLKDVRVVASYDALDSPWQRAQLDQYMSAAHAAGARVLLSFGHSRIQGKEHHLPTVATFTYEFLRFRARYPWVKDYLTWNEANHCSQPTCKHPRTAARFYLAIRRHCRGCRVVAADVLDGSKMVSWVKRFAHAVGTTNVIWGLHNYIDANRFRERGTKALLQAVKGQVWFTETGGVVKRTNGSPVEFPESTAHAAKATDWVFRLAELSSRVRRVYLYHWTPPTAPHATWDSALVDPHGRPRPAYKVLRRWVSKLGAR
jgi:hypothetical protein